MLTSWCAKIAIAATTLVAVAGLLAAQTPDKPKDIPTFGVSTELVYLRFHVEKKSNTLNE